MSPRLRQGHVPKAFSDMTKRISFCLLIFLLALAANPVKAQPNVLSNTSPLSFNHSFGSLSGNLKQTFAGVNVGVSSLSQLTFTQDVLLFSQSDLGNAISGQSGGLGINASNALAILRLQSNTSLVFSTNGELGIPGTKVNETFPIQLTDLSYVLSDNMGVGQNVTMANQLVYTGSLPVVGEFTMFVRPVIQWLPVLAGSLAVAGPASLTGNQLSWTSGMETSGISFSGDAPVTVSLTNPILSLEELTLSLEFPLIIGDAPFTLCCIHALSLGTFSISAGAIPLLFFQPNLGATQADEFSMPVVVLVAALIAVSVIWSTKKAMPKSVS